MIRITCPSCQAAYEVPPDAIPLAGREVVCAGCGHAWMQGWGPLQTALASDRNGGDAHGGRVTLEPGFAEAPAAGFFHRRADALPSGDRPRTAFTGPRHAVDASLPRDPGDHALYARPRTRPGWPDLQDEFDLPSSGGRCAPGTAAEDRDSDALPGTGRPLQPSPGLPDWFDFRAERERADAWPSVADSGMSEPEDDDDEPELFGHELPPVPRREIDPSVLEVLRTEAQRESEARARDASIPVETQGELPLPPPARRDASGDLRERLARLKAAEESGTAPRWTTGQEGGGDGFEPDPPAPSEVRKGFPPLPPAATPAPAKGLRRGPEVDRSAIAGAAVAAQATQARLPAPLGPRELAIYHEVQHRKGFRIGFALPVVVAAVVVGVYLAAAPLAAQWPAADPALAAVARFGDSVQLRLATGIHAAFDRLAGL